MNNNRGLQWYRDNKETLIYVNNVKFFIYYD